MTNNIIPPPELVQEWIGDYYGCPVSGELAGVETAIATRAAQWGSDQELKACCIEVSFWGSKGMAEKLRTARRPKPLTLKEQALAALETEPEDSKELIVFDTDQVNIIRRALEQLDA